MVPGAMTCSIPECEQAHYARTWCKRHYSRWQRWGTPLGSAPTSEDRFWQRVNRTESCWLWVGVLNEHGYGTLGNRLAHRLAYELFVAPIPQGLVLDHLCRVPACVRPDHLEPVTHRENTLRGRGQASRQYRRNVCKRGHPLYGFNIKERDGHRACLMCRWMASRGMFDQESEVWIAY